MILNTTQWLKLQDNIKKALPFFEKYLLFGEGITTFKKIVNSTLYQLQQVRKYEDWDKFLEDIPKEKKLEPELVINFANSTSNIDWPSRTEDRTKEERPLYKALESKENYEKGWRLHHNIFGFKFDAVTRIHYNTEQYDGIVYIHYTSDKVDSWGIMISENEYIPISVEF